MMTKSKLDEALKQIDSLAALMNAYLYPIQLNTMATTMTHVCPITIKMKKYEYKKENRRDWGSISFYSHDNGYKMCLNIVVNGYGDSRGTHLSAFLLFMMVSYDDELTWPVRGEFEVKLLNQISDSEHHSKMVKLGEEGGEQQDQVIEDVRGDYGWGYPNYISNEDLQKSPSCQFLKNDCLFFQIQFKG